MAAESNSDSASFSPRNGAAAAAAALDSAVPVIEAPLAASATTTTATAAADPFPDDDTANFSRRVHHDAACPSDEETPLLAPNRRRRRANSYSTADISRTRFYLLMAVIGIQICLTSFDGTVMSSSHPVITSHFHASHLAPWLSTGFILANIAANPLMTALADPVGRRGIMMVNGAIIFLATLWCACAGSMVSLIVARTVTGAALAGWTIVGNLMIADLVSIEKRGTWQAMTNLAWGSGGAAGAATGGILADWLGWRWLFGIQLPLILTLTLIYIIIPANLGVDEDKPTKTVREAMKSFDYAGCALISISATSFVLLASIGGNVVPWSHPIIIASAVVSLATGILFVRAETRAANPVYPLRLMVGDPFAKLYGAQVLFGMVINGLYFNVPLYFQAVLLNTPSWSGLRLMVPTLGNMVFGITSSLIVRYTGLMAPYTRVGVFLLCVGTVCATFYSRAWPEWAYWASLAPVGAAAGLFFPTSSIACFAHTDKTRQPAASGLLHLSRCMGVVLGVSTFGLVLQNALLRELEETVEGPDRLDVIARARRSVEAVHELPEPYLGQVVTSYEAAMHYTFLSMCVVIVLAIPVVMSMRLMRIQVAK